MVPQGTLRFAGVHAQGDFAFMRSTSSAPDPITAQFYPDVTLPPVGDIVIEFNGNSIISPMCRFSRSEIAFVGGGGRMLEVTFEDRRWLWATKPLFCSFNPKDSNNAFRYSAKQIVEYIVREVLGEVDANTAAFQEDYTFPVIVSDGEPAIDALETILDERGYIVTLSMSNHLVIHRKGVGVDIFQDNLLSEAEFSQDFKAVPQVLRVVSEPIVWQDFLPLEPVGEETDGSIVGIESLSYKPANGWGKENPKTFSNVDSKFRDLAKRCVWRMYRVKSGFDVKVPDDYPLDKSVFSNINLQSILPLMASESDSEKEVSRIMGFFYDHHSTRKNNAEIPPGFGKNYFDQASILAPDEKFVYQGEFSIDDNTGIVKFSKPVYHQKRNPDGTLDSAPYQPAALLLCCPFNVRQSLGQFVRHFYTYYPPNFTAYGHEVNFLADGLKYRIIGNYDHLSGAFKTEASAIASEAMTQFNSFRSVVARYKGFRFDMQPDGLINMVRFKRNSDGSTFDVDWNAETGMDRLTYKEKVKRVHDEANKVRAKKLDRMWQAKRNGRRVQ